MIGYFINRCPSLTRTPDRSGRLPLEVALASGRTWHSGVKELILLDSRVLARRDPASGLYPFQSMAPFKDQSDFELEPPVTKRRISSGKQGFAVDSEDEPTALDHCDLDRLATIYHLLRDCPRLVPSA